MSNSKYRYWFGFALLALVIFLVFQGGKEISNRPSTPPEVALVHDESAKPIAGSTQSNRAVGARSTAVLPIPDMWPEALKNAAQAPPNAARFLESELAALKAGQKYTGNFLHYQDLSHRCSMKRQVDKIPNTGGHFINATSARSIAWVEAYLAVHCPAFEALRPKLKDWVSQGGDDACTGGADRVAERAGAAVNIDLGRIKL